MEKEVLHLQAAVLSEPSHDVVDKAAGDEHEPEFEDLGDNLHDADDVAVVERHGLYHVMVWGVCVEEAVVVDKNISSWTR